jgi:hypothetical protein
MFLHIKNVIKKNIIFVAKNKGNTNYRIMGKMVTSKNFKTVEKMLKFLEQKSFPNLKDGNSGN